MIQLKVRDLIDSLDNISYVGGTSRTKNIKGIIQRGLFSMLSEIKPKELTTTELIHNAVHNRVFRYKAPDKLNRKYVLNLSEVAREYNVDTFHDKLTLVSNKAFYTTAVYDKNMFTIEYENGVKYLSISQVGQTDKGFTIHTMDSLYDNGHWNVGGNISNLTDDPKTFISGNGCLKFDINDSSNTGYIENFTLKPIDLTGNEKTGTIFTWLDLPNYNEIVSVKLSMYSSLSDRYEITVNTPHDGDKFAPGQNLIGFEMENAKVFGVPQIDNINRIRITIESTGNENIKDVRIDNIVLRNGTVFALKFVTDWIFKDAESNEIKFDYNSEDDIITLEYDTYMCLFYECALALVHDIYGPSETTDPVINITRMKKEQYEKYKQNNKDEFILESQSTYSMNTSYDNEYGYNPR